LGFTPLLCSECFQDEGLRIEAEHIGHASGDVCPTCRSTTGMKLDLQHLEKLNHRFFVQGSIPHGVGGYVPILQFNPESTGADDQITMRETTWSDRRLIGRYVNGRLFFYAPALWRLGLTEHYGDGETVSDEIISTIVTQLTIRVFVRGSKTYRIRKNPASSLRPSE
jgi:hypothetical protein